MNLKISIVTSCFDAEAFIDQTLQSVLSQQYPALEYIVIDGASRDRTLQIAERHRHRLAVLRSEPDRGQYDGIAKGLALATGEVVAWLNADDLYLPWTLAVVDEVFRRFPGIDWIVGRPAYADARGHCTRMGGPLAGYDRRAIARGGYQPVLHGYLQQESMFWRRRLWERVGGFDPALSLAADFDLWRRFAEHAELVSVATPLALFRQRPGEQRSSREARRYEAEVASVCAGLPPLPPVLRLRSRIGRRSEAARHLLRTLHWHRAPVVAYSTSLREWQCSRTWRPMARTGIDELLLERALRGERP